MALLAVRRAVPEAAFSDGQVHALPALERDKPDTCATFTPTVMKRAAVLARSAMRFIKEGGGRK